MKRGVTVLCFIKRDFDFQLLSVKYFVILSNLILFSTDEKGSLKGGDEKMKLQRNKAPSPLKSV